MINPQITSFVVDGIPYNCTYDANNDQFECVGPDPQNNNPTYSVNLCFHSDNGGDWCLQNMVYQKPQNCDDAYTPPRHEICDGLPGEWVDPCDHHILASRSTGPKRKPWVVDPCRIVITILQLSMNAWRRHVLTNGQYHFHFEGNDANFPYIYDIYADPNPNCNGEFNFWPSAYCNQGFPQLDVTWVPANEALTSITINGFPNQTIAINPGSVTTSISPFLQGTQAFVQVTIGNHPPLVKPINVPQCDGKKLTWGQGCVPQPFVMVSWLPITDTLDSITFNGNPAPIVVADPGQVQIKLDAALQGQPIAMEVCIQGRPCFTKNFIGAKCEPGDVSITPMCHPTTNEPMLNVWYIPAVTRSDQHKNKQQSRQHL